MEDANKEQLQQALHELAKFQFILSEGRKGNHLLFDSETIRQAFRRDTKQLSQLLKQNLDAINEALNRSFSFESFEEKRAFIDGLPSDVKDAMIFGYFQLLDGQEGEPGEKIVH